MNAIPRKTFLLKFFLVVVNAIVKLKRTKELCITAINLNAGDSGRLVWHFRIDSSKRAWLNCRLYNVELHTRVYTLEGPDFPPKPKI